MKAKETLIGVLWYLAGATALLTVALLVTGGGLLEMVDVADLIVLAGGALVVALASLTVQHLEYQRPTPGAGDAGARPAPREPRPVGGSVSWASLAAVVGAAVAAAVTPSVAASEPPVARARGSFERLVIDGDRDGVSVVLDHGHANEMLARRGGRPCAGCHHLDRPGTEATPCADCHRSMSGETDIFDHDSHAAHLGGNRGCVECHPFPDVERTRENVRPCGDCHARQGDRALWAMVPEGSRIEIGSGMAPSYVDAMHGVCVGCHREANPELARCPACHRPGTVGD